MELTETQQVMFDGSLNSIKAHLTLYGFKVRRYKSDEIIISDGKGNQLILRAIK